MIRFVTLLAVCAILVACGGNGDDDPESAGDAMKRQIETYSKAQYGRHWDDLHPAHQSLVTRDQYIDCRQRGGGGPQIDSVEVIETYEEPLTVTGIGTVDTVAVTLRLTAGTRTENVTPHVIDVDGTWRWIMADDTIEECGG